MRERLFLQYNGSEPVQCQVMDSNGQPAASRYRGGLADIGRFSENRQLVVIVPADGVIFFRPEVPRTAATRLRQAIPYLLEDNLLETVDHYHFALGRRDDSGHIPVAVLPDARMAEWRRGLIEAGLSPAMAVPDLLCLPWQEGEWTLYLEEGLVRLRNGLYSGLVCEWDSLPTLLHGLLSEGKPERVLVFRESPSGVDDKLSVLKSRLDSDSGLAELAQLEWVTRESPLFELCIHNFHEETALNLLQGEYKPRREFNRQLGPWRMTAALVAVLLLMWGLDYLLGYWRLSRRLDWLDAQISREIHQGFPEIKTIRQPLNQVNAELAKLRGQSGSSRFGKLMGAMGKALQGSAGKLQEIHYRQDKLVVNLQFPDLQTVNNFEQALKAQSGLAVKVLSANKKDEAVEARVEISGGGA